MEWKGVWKKERKREREKERKREREKERKREREKERNWEREKEENSGSEGDLGDRLIKNKDTWKGKEGWGGERKIPKRQRKIAKKRHAIER
jgi:hypothetical protein